MQPPSPQSQDVRGAPSQECREAIELATQALAAERRDLAQYKLISVENALKGPGHAGAHVWRVAFKPRRLIPETAGEPIGAGGEIFVEVDVSARSARVSGHGE